MDKNVALSGIRLRRCKNRYHRHIFFWLIAAVVVNNIFILFGLLFPLVDELKEKYEGNGFGWKHMFQHELAHILMTRGTHMCNVTRRNRAATTLISCYRSGTWKAVWRRIRGGRRAASIPSVVGGGGRRATATASTDDDAPRRAGRPLKTKRASGGGRNKRARTNSPPPKKPLTKKEMKVRRLSQDRLNCFEFQSPPPFQPKRRGRKRKGSSGPTIYAHGRQHTLVHASTLGIWKKAQGRCVSCYVMAPPVAKGRRKYMADGTSITSTNFACNVCKKRLCPDCHHNTWSPHFENKYMPRSIVYSSRST